MDIERRINPEQQLEILENLKPKLGNFFQEMVYGEWGLQKEDVRLVDEIGFGLAGIPIYGPELSQHWPHVDIVVRQNKYKGPRSEQEHPRKIIFPMKGIPLEDILPARIGKMYGIAVADLLKEEDILDLPSLEVKLVGVPVLVPEPVAHVKTFAEHTILSYSLEQAGADKIKEWFLKLKMLRNISRTLHKPDVQMTAQEALEKSVSRWANQGWNWLVID